MSGQSVILNIEIIRDRAGYRNHGLDPVEKFCFRRKYLKYLESCVDSLALSSRAAPIPGIWGYQNLFHRNSSERVSISGIHANKLLETGAGIRLWADGVSKTLQLRSCTACTILHNLYPDLVPSEYLWVNPKYLQILSPLPFTDIPGIPWSKLLWGSTPTPWIPVWWE